VLHFVPEINHRYSTFSGHRNACSSILTGCFICPPRKTLWIFYIRMSTIDIYKLTYSCLTSILYCTLTKSYKRRKSNTTSDNMKNKGPIKHYLQRNSSSIGGGVMRSTKVVGHRFWAIASAFQRKTCRGLLPTPPIISSVLPKLILFPCLPMVKMKSNWMSFFTASLHPKSTHSRPLHPQNVPQ